MDPENVNSVKQDAQFYESRTNHRKHDSTFSVLLLFFVFFALNGMGYMHLAMRLAYVEGQLALQCAQHGQLGGENPRQQHGVIEKFEQSWEQPANNEQQRTGALQPSPSLRLNVGRAKRSEDDGSFARAWEVRLFHPKSAHGKRHKRHHLMAKGVVEVKIDGQWGRICDRNWGIDEANVVCRYLGHDGATRSYRRAAASFGDYFSPDYSLGDVECTGSEQSLQECNHDFDTTSCRGKFTAGVKCAVTDECASNPCKNGGTCRDGLDRYTCDCQLGWEGRNCDIEINRCNSSPCKNNATCHGGQYDYTCHCTAGWEGKDCEIDSDECEVDPCKNNATCVDGVNTYSCLCVPGWEGHDCEIHNCASDPCQNNGTCHVTTDGYKCACAPGRQGHHCENLENVCDSNPCQNHGTCHNGGDHYICRCPHGWVGVHCETVQAENKPSALASANESSTHGHLGIDSKSSPAWVHIVARSDSSDHAITIKSGHGVLTGHWKTVRSNKFHFDHGKLKILEEGDYYIYSQIHFIENEILAFTTNYTVMVASEHGGPDHFLTCVHEMYGFPPYKTCFTAGMRKLYKKDVVYLYVPCDGCVIALDHDTTFFGVMKLS